MTIENNSEAWREVRSRVDSIANAIFLVAGGALSLSITVMLGEKSASFLSPLIVKITIQAWYALLVAVIVFLLLKSYLVFLSFALQRWPNFVNKNLDCLNSIGWILGILGIASFIGGLIQMVRAASIAIGCQIAI